MMIILVSVFLIGLFFFLVKGRNGHEAMPELRNYLYAHRGLHGNGVPENSMAAFRKAKEAGYGVELDVHLLKDGNLAVIHDASLKRTAGADVLIEDLTAPQLQQYTLEGTQEKIPLLSQVLELYQGVAPLIVELKSERGNHVDLCSAACKLLKKYNGSFCIESFDPRCISWLRRNECNFIRGQLTENFFHSENDLPVIVKFVMKHQLMNVVTRPDFVAYRFSDRKTISNFISRKVWGVQGVTWTITNQEELDTALNEGWIPIFENFLPKNIP